MKIKYYKIFIFILVAVILGIFLMNHSYSILVINNSTNHKFEEKTNLSNKDSTDVFNDKVTYNSPQEQENDEMRKELEIIYDITISYGNELDNYSALGHSPILLTDPAIINEYLILLSNELKKYPDDFFREIKENKLSLSIFLINDFSNSDVLGYTDYDNHSKTIITISCNSSFENTFHHEIMHFIDNYINLKNSFNSVKYEWIELNPTNYSYGNNEKEYVFSETKSKNSYFLNNYAQTNYLEDRAVLFGDIMSDGVGEKCYEKGTPLYNKIELLNKQIDEYFDCISYTQLPYWSLYL